VAITADHGELLGEHGLFAHGNTVREEALRVPLVLAWYGKRPAPSIDRRRLASQVDIAPTLLAELGIPAPPTWSGTALQQPLAREFTYFQEGAEVGLLDQRDPRNEWKYWVNVRTGKEYAFNVSADAREMTNMVDKVPVDQRREWRLRVMPGASLFFERNF
jgi:arylsulfatase A-like enzyme